MKAKVTDSARGRQLIMQKTLNAIRQERSAVPFRLPLLLAILPAYLTDKIIQTFLSGDNFIFVAAVYLLSSAILSMWLKVVDSRLPNGSIWKIFIC